MNKVKTVSALTLDIKKDGWKKSTGFIMRQVPMPALDEKRNPEDSLSVIVKVKYAGVCGTDRGIWHRQAFKDLIHSSLKGDGKTIRILGHEFVGEIVKMGSMVKSLYYDLDPQNKSKIEVGNLVSGDSHVSCGRCYQCRLGEDHVCMNESILGISIDGIFAKYVKIPAKNLWAVDKNRVREEIAAMYDPFGNAVHAISKVDVRGQRVAVFGAGPIGLFSVLLLRNFGAAKVIVVDYNEKNLKMAKDLGAHEIIQIKPRNNAESHDDNSAPAKGEAVSSEKSGNKSDPEVIKRILKLTYGKGVDISMEMAGPASSLNNAIDSTRRGGQVILFGIKDGDFIIPKFSRLIVKGLTLHGVIGRRIFTTWQVAQRVLSDKSNGVQDKIWDVILKKGRGTVLSFDKYNKEDFETAMKENPKIIFKF